MEGRKKLVKTITTMTSANRLAAFGNDSSDLARGWTHAADAPFMLFLQFFLAIISVNPKYDTLQTIEVGIAREILRFKFNITSG